MSLRLPNIKRHKHPKRVIKTLMGKFIWCENCYLYINPDDFLNGVCKHCNGQPLPVPAQPTEDQIIHNESIDRLHKKWQPTKRKKLARSL